MQKKKKRKKNAQKREQAKDSHSLETPKERRKIQKGVISSHPPFLRSPTHLHILIKIV